MIDLTRGQFYLTPANGYQAWRCWRNSGETGFS
jgi:hypothetical protein